MRLLRALAISGEGLSALFQFEFVGELKLPMSRGLR